MNTAPDTDLFLLEAELSALPKLADEWTRGPADVPPDWQWEWTELMVRFDLLEGASLREVVTRAGDALSARRVESRGHSANRREAGTSAPVLIANQFIPVKIRRVLGISTDDRVGFIMEDNQIGSQLTPSVVDRTAGALSGAEEPLSAEDLRVAAEQAIAEEASGRHRPTGVIRGFGCLPRPDALDSSRS